MIWGEKTHYFRKHPYGDYNKAFKGSLYEPTIGSAQPTARKTAGKLVLELLRVLHEDGLLCLKKTDFAKKLDAGCVVMTLPWAYPWLTGTSMMFFDFF